MPNSTRTNSRIRTIRADHYDRIRENTHVLYRCFNRRKSLLYVGITNHPEQRIKHHQVHKTWWKYVETITLEQFSSRAELVSAEAEAIRTENPCFNLVTPSGGANPQQSGKARNVWPEASAFNTVQPDYGLLIDMTIEQQLYPCVECHARAIHCDGDTVACRLCASQWTFDQWFAMTFTNQPDTPVGHQMPLM